MVVSFIFSRAAGIDDPSTCRVLDLGCGAGNNVWFLAREGFDVTGIDISQSAIDFAKQRLASEGLSADLRVGDFASLVGIDDNAFDVVIDRGAITCNRRAEIEGTLDEVRRILKPNGVFFSQMISWDHGSRPLGQDLGDGCYDNFTGGSYKGVSKIFFADAATIDALYGSRFKIVSKEHATIDRGDPATRNAHWRVVCRNA
jgi:SAM-dependent methyltransferase